jgi:hypothetical protein
MKMEYSKAAYASSLVALILVIAISFISSGGRMYFAGTDWAKVNSMNYEEGQQYLIERSQSITRWDSLKSGIDYPAFWMSALSDWAVYFLVGFVSCVLYGRLSQSNKSLNSAPQSGAN